MISIIFVIYFAVFIYSVILHEVAHGWVALKFGDDTAKKLNRLTLNPIPHIDPIGSLLMPFLLVISQSPFLFGWAKPVPVNFTRLKGGKAAYRWVAAAGILTNLALAVIAAALIKVLTNIGLGTENLGVIMLVLAFVLNIVLAVFNAMPLPSFDGYNFLMTFNPVAKLVAKTPLANPMIMARYGLFISLALLFLFFSVISQIINYIMVYLALGFGIIPQIAAVLDLL